MITPNLGHSMRALYVVAGLGLVGVSLFAGLTGQLRWIVMAVGVVAFLEGAVGW